MPIEFRCNQCGRLLRTGDETVGRQAQCPECGALSQVPGPGQVFESSSPLAPLQAEDPGSSGNAFGSNPEWGGTRGAESPYPSHGPQAYYVPPAQRISAPATALIITGILGISLQMIGILLCMAQMGVGVGVARGPDKFPLLLGSGMNLVFGVIGLAVSVVVIVGATKMKNLEHYTLAVTSAILAVIPCTSPCCLLGIPFGIWALVVLNDSSVKAAFRS